MKRARPNGRRSKPAPEVKQTIDYRLDLEFIERFVNCALRGGATLADVRRVLAALGISDIRKIEKERLEAARTRGTSNLKQFPPSDLAVEKYLTFKSQARTRKELASRCGYKSLEGLRKYERKHGLR